VETEVDVGVQVSKIPEVFLSITFGTLWKFNFVSGAEDNQFKGRSTTGVFHQRQGAVAREMTMMNHQ
jgi:hypothetical protein